MNADDVRSEIICPHCDGSGFRNRRGQMQRLADLTTLTTLYAFLVSAQDLAHLTHHAQIRADLDALVLRVDGLVSEVGDRMIIGYE